MRAQLLRQPAPVDRHPLEVADLPDPLPVDGEVLIEVEACGVCRTDLQLVEGDLTAHRLPIVPGHQIVGRVVAIGPGGDEALVGQRVGVAWLASTCGQCRFCRSGRENLCDSARFTGWDRDGGFATLVTARSEFVYLLPGDVQAVSAAPLLCGGAIGYRSLRIAGVGPADPDSQPGTLGLFGFGASATCAIQVARYWGWEVYVATRSEREQDRARSLGAVWAGSYDDRVPEDLDAAVTFAPAGAVVIKALESVRKGGTVAINAIHLDHIPEFAYEKLWWERSLRSVANVTRADVWELLALAVRIPIETQVERFSLEAAGEALLALRDGAVSGAAVLEL
ncbi:MAG: zinc-dependent alcohol dehydrogenase family protein [Acidimicrobiales bacterium]|nr:zinc-dependent alcohol dehydrogenase family protein [Acidimicrobiales bacterium]